MEGHAFSVIACHLLDDFQRFLPVQAFTVSHFAELDLEEALVEWGAGPRSELVDAGLDDGAAAVDITLTVTAKDLVPKVVEDSLSADYFLVNIFVQPFICLGIVDFGRECAFFIFLLSFLLLQFADFCESLSL